MSHAPHESLRGYSPNQILVDSCAACEDRCMSLSLGIADLDDEAAQRLREQLLVSAGEVLTPVLDRARRRHELGSTDLPDRALRLPFDLLLHDALIRGRLGDDDIHDIVAQCVVPLYATLSRGYAPMRRSP